MKPDQLARTLSLICLTLMFALLFEAGASAIALAVVGAGAALILSACFLAERGTASDGN